METVCAETYLGYSLDLDRRFPGPLRDQPHGIEPYTSFYIPLLPNSSGCWDARRDVRSIWEGVVGSGFCGLLYRRPLLYARIHHAEIPATLGEEEWTEESGEAEQIHGADVYSYLLWLLGTRGAVCYEPDAGVVFQYKGDV